MTDYFRILRGLQLDETVTFLQGSGPPGSTPDTDNALVGSVYVDNVSGLLYSKTTAGFGPTMWSQTSGTPTTLFAEKPVAPVPPVASGDNSVAIGSAAVASAQDAMAHGTSATAAGVGSFAAGSNATANGDHSIALGNQSVSRFLGGEVLANDRFGNPGDAQTGRYLLRNITTNNVLRELFLDGVTGTQRLVLPDDSTWSFIIRITGHRTDTGDGHAGYELRGVIYRNTGAASVTIQGTPAKTVLAESNTPWDVQVGADVTNGSLQIQVKGQNGKTVRWLALVETVEVTN